MSLLTALEDPAPAGPPVAPPAVVADALPEPESCALSRAPRSLSPLMALEEPAPAGPPVAPPAAAASLELAPCASASVEPSVSTEDKTIVVSFMSYPFAEVFANVPNRKNIANAMTGNNRSSRHRSYYPKQTRTSRAEPGFAMKVVGRAGKPVGEFFLRTV